MKNNNNKKRGNKNEFRDNDDGDESLNFIFETEFILFSKSNQRRNRETYKTIDK